MARVSVCVYHFLVWGWYIFINCYFSFQGDEQQLSQVFSYGGRWRYLTMLNLHHQIVKRSPRHKTYVLLLPKKTHHGLSFLMAMGSPRAGYNMNEKNMTTKKKIKNVSKAIFFGIACLDDVMKVIKRKRDIKWITASRELLFTTLAFPLSTFVFMSFWALFLYDRELVFPKALDNIFPKWMNHAMHTSVLPISLIEVMLYPYRYPSKKTGLFLSGCAAFAYICWVLRIYSVTKEWVYPVFAKLSPNTLAAFFLASYILLVCIYLLGEQLNRLIWGGQLKQPKKTK